MPIYRAPLDDYRFVLNELLEIDKQRDLPQFAELTPDLVEDILTNAAKFCEEVLQPINQSGDEEGAHYENGVVRTPKGFKEAYKAYSEAGWGGLGAPASLGGAEMPMTITMAVAEMAMSANQSFAMYPGLTSAAYSALAATGAPWMREHVAKKMISGEWCGTMCLTEPNCGTDLRLMKTRAVEQPDGTYRMTGTKIFISGGDHDLTDNIIHMVIAKIPDENGQIHDDLSTVNFFMVPKFLVGEDGKMGARNGVTTGGIEKKMGIKAQATCVLNFDNAVAWRLGPKPVPPKPGEKRSASAGMAGMFGMMNGARMGVGIQGISIGEVAYQNGYAYAHERRVGHALTGPAEPDKPADLEFVHAPHAAAFQILRGRRARGCDVDDAQHVGCPLVAAGSRSGWAARRPDDAGDQGLLHRHGVRGCEPRHAVLWRPRLHPRQWRRTVRARCAHQPDL
jgi:alkylation response protein AidB-like acyl-CoA dehydrogenase